MQWLEVLAMLDILWSVISLSLLTATELYFQKTIKFIKVITIIKIIKLIACCIDIIAATYLFYFEILGFENKIFKEHHEMNKDINQSESKPLLTYEVNTENNIVEQN